jgi:TolB-like protein/Tfp pilus assembly protein PilF
MSFLQELKRRKVMRVAIAYLFVAWAIVQVAATSFPLLNFPERWASLVLILAIAGFPVTLILAWAFELSPEGVRRTRLHDDAPTRPWPLAVRIAATAVAVSVLAAGAFAAYRRVSAAPKPASIRTIAVLPFRAVGGDSMQQSFSDGISEQLLNELARIDDLNVIARSSSFEFRGENEAADAQRKLDAQAVLTGSVTREGQNVRVRARLVDASTGVQIWSDQYDRVISSVLELQDEITRAIVGALDLRLAGALHTGGTTNAAALEAFFAGLTLWHRRGEPELLQALTQFETAITHDPRYAQAYAFLAQTYAVLPLFAGAFSAPEAAQKGKEAARRALEIAPDLPEAHAALSQIALNLDLDLVTAEREALKATQLRPSYATAHQWYAEVLQAKRSIPAARAALQRALKLDPVAPAARNIMSFQLMLEGKQDEAVAYTRETIRLRPDFSNAGDILLFVLMAVERYEQADSIVAGRDPAGMHVMMQGAIASREGRLSAPEYQRAVAALPTIEQTSALLGSIMAAILKLDDRAVELLARGIDRKEVSGLYFINWPGFDRLRSRPDFQAILKKIGAVS